MMLFVSFLCPHEKVYKWNLSFWFNFLPEAPQYLQVRCVIAPLSAKEQSSDREQENEPRSPISVPGAGGGWLDLAQLSKIRLAENAPPNGMIARMVHA